MIAPNFLLRRASLLALALATLFLAGCLQERFFWSPDGTRAAILTEAGLRLCDADGKLSPVLAPDVHAVAWLADSQRLVLVRTRAIKDFPALAAALGPQRTAALRAKAESIWAVIQTRSSFEDMTDLQPLEEAEAILLYLREHHHDRLRELAGKEWKKDDNNGIETMTATWRSLVVARLAGDKLEFGPTLLEGISSIAGLRPAPGGSAIAFVAQAELNPNHDDSLQTFLVPIDGSTPAVVVASKTGAYPDWSHDGRSLLYFAASGNSSSSDLRLGALVERTVLDADGHIALAEKSSDLAGLIFHDTNRIRCLPDGRVLFNATEFHLPTVNAADKTTREEFFVFDPAKSTVARLFAQGALERLPRSLEHFALSPDGAALLVSADQGEVWLLDPASGKVEQASPSTDKGDTAFAAAWRKPGEFTYQKKISARIELVLRHGTGETILSRTWPDEILGKKKE